MARASFARSFRVRSGDEIDLAKIDTDATHGADKEAAEAEVQQLAVRLRDLQYTMYAENRHSLLVVLQAMDGGGKDGTIRHVFGAMNPQGVRTHAFKVPTPEEAAHDFLWRAHEPAPRRGEAVLFNRSHYEDVLVARVHRTVKKKVWKERYDLINAFEENLAANGTTILKFYLHISPEEQLRRFQNRLEAPSHQWKIEPRDYAERELWTEYRKAYEDAIAATSTSHAPWFVIPADKKWFRNLAVGRITVEALQALKMRFPKPSVDLDEIHRLFHTALRSRLR